MDSSEYTIRNFNPADFDKFVRLIIEAEKLEPAGRFHSPPDIRQYLNRPNYSPEGDLFLAEMAGKIVGYLDVTPELAINRVILDGWVHPKHRRQGLAVGLLAAATERVRNLGVGTAHISIPEGSTVAREALSRLGFSYIRRRLVLELDMNRVSSQGAAGGSPVCRHLEVGEEDKLTLIQNRAFAGSWGYNPNTVETIAHRINLGTCSPGDVILACGGDEVVGYCWTEVIGEGAGGRGKGRIYMIGVDPDHRGRGVGEKVLRAGLAYLKGKGVTVTELNVDGENEAALALYRSFGFEIRESDLWYEKYLL